MNPEVASKLNSFDFREKTKNQAATCYIGNLDERMNESLLWELMLQAGPVAGVHLPKDRVSQGHQGYGFVEFQTEEDADYAIRILNMIKVFGKPIRVNKATVDKKELDIGANLFIGNLDAEVDEKMLYDTFIAFGRIVQTPKIARELDSGISRGFGFIAYDSFDSADAAIEAMNNRFLANKPIQVSYAQKRDGKGDLHGSGAERMLAAQAKKHNIAIAPQPPPSLPSSIPAPHVMQPMFMPSRPPMMAAGGGFPMMPPMGPPSIPMNAFGGIRPPPPPPRT